MDKYASTAFSVAKLVTNAYSTSFGGASRLFAKPIRKHIYAIYGLVRIADEIVDTYRGDDARQILDELQAETTRAVRRGYSANPVVHAFALAAAQYGIDDDLTRPFFVSMAMDLVPQHYDQQLLDTYIHGSAEVIGLMCLRVFCDGDQQAYGKLAPGARRLGAAYQKVNFLRDIAHDIGSLERDYFAIGGLPLTDEVKRSIEQDIRQDFQAARTYIDQLPSGARDAVRASFVYYHELLSVIVRTPATTLSTTRIRVSDRRKTVLLAGVMARRLRGARI